MISVSKGNININLSLIGRILKFSILVPVFLCLLAGALWSLGLGINYSVAAMTWNYSIEKVSTTLSPEEDIESTTEYAVNMTPGLFGDLYPDHQIDRRVLIVKFNEEEKEKFYLIDEDGTYSKLWGGSQTMRRLHSYEGHIKHAAELERVRQLTEESK